MSATCGVSWPSHLTLCWATICAGPLPSRPIRSYKTQLRKRSADGPLLAFSSKTTSAHGNRQGSSRALQPHVFRGVEVLVRHVWCARVDSNHHPAYTGQGPQPYSAAPYTSASVQIVRSVRVCGHIGCIGQNDLCQRCVTGDSSHLDALASGC